MLNPTACKIEVKTVNRTIAETIVKERSGIRLVETIEYYLNELVRLEKELTNALT